jgi:hypothetical protein
MFCNAAPEVCLPAKLNPAMKPFGEKNLDILRNIRGAGFRPARFSAQLVFSSVHGMCERRLGRAATADTKVPLSDIVRSLKAQGPPDAAPKNGGTRPSSRGPAAMTCACYLEGIQKSISRWSNRGGRHGYLKFVVQYLP